MAQALSSCRALVPWSPPLAVPRADTDIVVTPHPITLHSQRQIRAVGLLPGETLEQVLRRHDVDLEAEGWEVSIDGVRVPFELLGKVRPKTGHLIEARRVAGKSALRIVALIAIMVIAPQVGAFLFGSGIAGTIAGVALQMVGSAIVNKVLGPKMPRVSAYDQQTGSTYSLSGGRNRARHYEPIGLVLGVVKVVPDSAAQPYSWFDSDDQYMYVRLHAGINCGSVSDIRIGATAITSYTDVTVSQAGFPGVSTQLQDWSSVDTVAGGAVEAVTAPGGWVTRTSSAGTIQLAVDIGAQLYSMNDDGGYSNAAVTIEIERRLLPSGAWQPFTGATAAMTINNMSTKPVRMTVATGSLTPGQYEVRMRKMTLNASTNRNSNSVEWGVLKSYQADTTNYASHPQVGIRIKATGQLNGSLDEVSWVATAAAAPVWTGSAWVTQATRNPGAQILQLARGIYDTQGRLMAGLGWSDSQIDIEGLKAFMVQCATKGYTFDYWFDQPLSCMELLEAVAAAGMGSISHHSGKLGVVWLDSARPIESVVNMANIKPGTFRCDYTTRELAQEIEAVWRDRDDGWLTKSMRVKAPGITTPRDTARLQPIGASTEASVLRAVRLSMAQNIYQRKTVSWEMDLEHLTFRRYSLLATTHDLTQWGYGGQLRGASTVGSQVVLQLDEVVPANSLATLRCVGLRLPGELQYRIFNVAAFTGESRSLTLTTAWPAGIPLPGSTADNPAHDTLWIYDFKAVPGQRLCVIDIEPNPDLQGAKITAVPEPNEFWTYVNSGAYEVPPLGPGLGVVVASNIRVSTMRADITLDGGTLLSVLFDVEGPYDHAQLWLARSGQPRKLVDETRTRRFLDIPVEAAGQYEIEVRPFDSLGRVGNGVSTVYSFTLTQVAAAGITVEYSVNGINGWHPTFAVGDIYMRQKVGNGAWSAAIKIVGEDGSDGEPGTPGTPGSNGTYVDYIFRRAQTQPATPTGTGLPAGWSGAPPTGSTLPLWMSRVTKQSTGALVGAWSAPVRLDADAGSPGFTWVTSSGVLAQGQVVEALSVAGGVWTEQAYSAEGFVGGAFCAFRPMNAFGVMCGLNEDPAASASWTTIDYAWNAATSSSCDIYESGVYIGSHGAFTSATRLLIDYDGYSVTYFKDGVAVRSVDVGSGRRLHLDMSFAYPGAKALDVVFGARGARGPGSFTWVSSPGMLAVGSTAEKLSADSWDQHAFSAESFVGGASVSWRFGANNKNVMFGLNEDPTASASYETLDHAVYGYETGIFFVYESGVQYGSFGTYSAATQFQIIYNGSTVRYLKDGVEFRSVASAPNRKLSLDSAFFSNGAKVVDVAFAAAGAQGAQGPQGAAGPAGAAGATGAAGAQGASQRIAYAKITGSTLASSPASVVTTGATSFPVTNTWGGGEVWQSTIPVYNAGESVQQINGVFNPTTNTTTWGLPFLANLKVGQLSAISADIGLLRTATTGARVEFQANRVSGYFANNVEAWRWSA